MLIFCFLQLWVPLFLLWLHFFRLQGVFGLELLGVACLQFLGLLTYWSKLIFVTELVRYV